ncbi:hypothetical protein PHMEG_00014904 [Phytophthora megakarya]|uniref:Uncharacterized protein n=1 Tax=Phytophthora megakarya TaxID=4795 RepID=A0A225W2M3_9STRA|nr:hypothetical protein PHMEG_00014904 [Phytophthora megakarya]
MDAIMLNETMLMTVLCNDVEAAIDHVDEVGSATARSEDTFIFFMMLLSAVQRPADERPADVTQLIESALESNSQWLPPSLNHNHSELRPYSIINNVFEACTLNQHQHVAFSLVATALLQRFKQQELARTHPSVAGYRANDFVTQLRQDQLLIFLGGAGGTGKRCAIDAIIAFCLSWHRSQSIVKTALTGKLPH